MNRSSAPRALFVPASGASGSGEVYRALAIAQALRRIAPAVETHLLLSHQAQIEPDSHVRVHRLTDTPARAGDEVLAVIDRLHPALAVFDGSGRTRQMAAVRQRGGRVVWISNRPGRRRRAFWPQRMRHIDLHLMVGHPPPRLGPFSRTLARIGGVQLTTARAIATPPGPLVAEIARIAEREPAVFVAGGGGQRQAGRPVTEIFHDAAERFHQQTGCPAVVIYGPLHPGTPRTHSIVPSLPALPPAALAALLARASLVVSGAGNMLSNQVLLARKPCVMTATGGHDQPTRLARYAEIGAVLAAPLDAEALASGAIRLNRDAALREQLIQGMDRLGLVDDTAKVARILAGLLQRGT
ncbi:MAG: hypothetical protein Kow0020_09350 [Wenzhouxiangellaceae bacterium]